MTNSDEITLKESITYIENRIKEIYAEAFLCHANPNDDKLDRKIYEGKMYEQIADYLKDLQAVKERYQQKKRR